MWDGLVENLFLLKTLRHWLVKGLEYVLSVSVISSNSRVFLPLDSSVFWDFYFKKSSPWFDQDLIF